MNILTFDIEEPWHTIPRDEDYELACAPFELQGFFERLIEELNPNDASPVLFWVGTVAERYKNTVRELANVGFHIGSHGYDHEDFATFCGTTLVDRLALAKRHLEDIVGEEVTAFRAPGFSVTDLNEFWSAQESVGFKYDFSVCDAARITGGGHNSGIVEPCQVPGHVILEFPMSFSQWLGQKIYVTGGGYYRIAPGRLLENVHLKRQYNMYYLHPIDFMKPSFKCRDPRRFFRKLRQEVRWGASWDKLARLLTLGDWHTGAIEEWVGHYE